MTREQLGDSIIIGVLALVGSGVFHKLAHKHGPISFIGRAVWYFFMGHFAAMLDPKSLGRRVGAACSAIMVWIIVYLLAFPHGEF